VSTIADTKGVNGGKYLLIIKTGNIKGLGTRHFQVVTDMNLFFSKISLVKPVCRRRRRA
jgi:hypothetical protein